jgi:8-oxo-dGTP diphosphatase
LTLPPQIATLRGVTEVVCGVIGDVDGRVLACRRPDGGHLAGFWEFPGGKVEDGETPAAALARELREELGIEVAVGESLTAVTWDYGRGPFRLLPFHCRILHGTPAPLEHSEIRWCRPAEANHLAWAAADEPVLAELRRSR